MTRQERSNLLKGLAFTAPWIIGLCLFTFYPCVMNVYYSLTDFSLLNKPAFVGMQNYQDMISDKVFIKTLSNTWIYTVMALPFGMIVALFLALLLNQKIIARPVFRTIFFLPSLVPLVALAVLWNWLFRTNDGAINAALGLIGITGPDWLGSTFWSKPALVITGLWGCGQAVVIYLAGLQDVPRDYYDAAQIDGANWYQQTVNITLPLISPVIYFNLIIGCIGTLQIFAVPYVMTNGGPMQSTLFYSMYLYQQAFRYLNMGYACAMAIVLFLMIAALTWLAHLISRKHVYYGGA